LTRRTNFFAERSADLGLITPPRDDDEWRKQITSALIAGKQVLLIDNVIHRLDSSALAAAWTGDK
jgi:hypothetical protein